jgi:hypothetical protein
MLEGGTSGMKIKVTIQLVEYKTGDMYKEAKRLMSLATKGIIEKHASRMRGMGQGLWADFTASAIDSCIIELEDEEIKKVEEV